MCHSNPSPIVVFKSSQMDSEARGLMTARTSFGLFSKLLSKSDNELMEFLTIEPTLDLMVSLRNLFPSVIQLGDSELENTFQFLLTALADSRVLAVQFEAMDMLSDLMEKDRHYLKQMYDFILHEKYETVFDYLRPLSFEHQQPYKFLEIVMTYNDESHGKDNIWPWCLLWGGKWFCGVMALVCGVLCGVLVFWWSISRWRSGRLLVLSWRDCGVGGGFCSVPVLFMRGSMCSGAVLAVNVCMEI